MKKLMIFSALLALASAQMLEAPAILDPSNPDESLSPAHPYKAPRVKQLVAKSEVLEVTVEQAADDSEQALAEEFVASSDEASSEAVVEVSEEAEEVLVIESGYLPDSFEASAR